MRKVYIEVQFRIIVEADEGVEICDVMDDLDYTLYSLTDGASVIDTQMRDYEITDSK